MQREKERIVLLYGVYITLYGHNRSNIVFIVKGKKERESQDGTTQERIVAVSSL